MKYGGRPQIYLWWGDISRTSIIAHTFYIKRRSCPYTTPVWLSIHECTLGIIIIYSKTKRPFWTTDRCLPLVARPADVVLPFCLARGALPRAAQAQAGREKRNKKSSERYWVLDASLELCGGGGGAGAGVLRRGF